MTKLSRSVLGAVASFVLLPLSGPVHADAAKAADQSVADKEFGRLSADGVSAFNDIHTARIAIFNGHPGEAAKLVSDALASLNKAKTDDALFVRAESDFHGSDHRGTSSQPPTAAKAAPVQWLPIDGEIVLAEDYNPPPDKAAAVVNANKSLEKGDSTAALQTVRLAAVDVDYTFAAAPLQQSIADVSEANRLMASHDYYGASQALRKAEAGIRYDEITDIAHVRGHAKPAGKSE